MIKNRAKVVLDPEGSLTLAIVLQSFTAGVNEEQAWALCYQCVKAAQCVLSNPSERDQVCLVTSTDHLRLHQDGSVHKLTFLDPRPVSEGTPRTRSPDECKIISNLVHVVHEALEYGMEEDAERVLSYDLEDFLDKMIYADESGERPETDDEGIERDSGDSDDDRVGSKTFNFTALLKVCQERLGSSPAGTPTSSNSNISSVADNHYKAVIRALVAETLELSTFLEKVAQGSQHVRLGFNSDQRHAGSVSPNSLSSEDQSLEGLHFTFWARLWVQVIRDLRNGVKLKKVDSPDSDRGPSIEYQLTPYEILMDDIRSRRYKLKQVMVDGELPYRVKRDAHELILEFIRGRPPLKKAEDRVLRPPPQAQLPPIEALMESIRQQEHSLRPTQTVVRSVIRKETSRSHQGKAQSSQGKAHSSQAKAHSSQAKAHSSRKMTTDSSHSETDHSDARSLKSSRSPSVSGAVSEKPPQPQRRLIKADLDALYCIDKDDESDEEYYPMKDNSGICHDGDTYHDHSQSEPVSPWKIRPDMTGQIRARCMDDRRRHTICNPTLAEEHASRMITFPLEYTNNSLNVYNSLNGPSVSPILHRRKANLPRSMSKSALQEQFFQSNQWQTAMECLSLNLEEVVHIRNVLTKAELESLPMDCNTKEDVEKGKVCFLCLKSRFSLFGAWGNCCKLCKRVVCTKCCSKMRIPMEHFANIPVSTLSPLLSPTREEETPSPSPVHHRIQSGRKNSVGSAPTSPSLSRKSDSDSGQPSISPGSLEPEERGRLSPDGQSGPYSLPTVSTISLSLQALKRRSFGRRKEDRTEKLIGQLMVVCHDCKAMVLQIIRSSKTKKGQQLKNNMTLDLP